MTKNSECKEDSQRVFVSKTMFYIGLVILCIGFMAGVGSFMTLDIGYMEKSGVALGIGTGLMFFAKFFIGMEKDIQ